MVFVFVGNGARRPGMHAWSRQHKVEIRIIDVAEL